ncbi:hypothetical protein ACTD5D_21905 [Nocardia takedensis]|uniref:hypothetical protein n=1 Tax=Nocardia takedensis TaxID=259390 RepID=UPI003F766DC6
MPRPGVHGGGASPAEAIGCLGGVIAIGAVVGQLLVTAPFAVMAVMQYFTTLNQPMPNHAKWVA